MLQAPFTTVADVAQCHFPYVPATLMVIGRFGSLSRIDKVRAPILILHGDRDRVVTVRFGRALFDAAPEPKESWFVPQARHGSHPLRGGLDAFTERPLRP
jgi:uncharacterized protein